MVCVNIVFCIDATNLQIFSHKEYNNEPQLLHISETWKPVMDKFLEYFKQQAASVNDENIIKEITALTTICNAPRKATHLLYFEPQQLYNSCFIHATNMYFQKTYLDADFETIYTNIIRLAENVIEKYKNAKASFYGTENPPTSRYFTRVC